MKLNLLGFVNFYETSKSFSSREEINFFRVYSGCMMMD